MTSEVIEDFSVLREAIRIGLDDVRVAARTNWRPTWGGEESTTPSFFVESSDSSVKVRPFEAFPGYGPWASESSPVGDG